MTSPSNCHYTTHYSLKTSYAYLFSRCCKSGKLNMFVEALTTLPGIPSHDESIRSLVIHNIMKAIVQAIHINCCYLYQYLFRQIYEFDGNTTANV